MLTDEMLYMLIPQIEKMLLTQLDTEMAATPVHKFSWHFRIKMWLIMRRVSQRATYAPSPARTRPIRARFIVTAVVAAIMLTVTAFAAVRIYRAYVQNSRANVEVTFSAANTSEIINSEFDIYEPEYIPSNFDLVKTTSNLDNDIGTYSLSYKNSNDNIIEYTQYSLKDLSINFATGSLELEEISINDSPAKLYFSSEWQTLWWYDEKYCYTVMSDLDKKEVVKIANSLKLKK